MQSYFKIEIQVFKNGKIRDFSTFEVNYLKSYVWLRKSDIVFEFSIQKRTKINWKFICGVKKAQKCRPVLSKENTSRVRTEQKASSADAAHCYKG